jgi:hypothetical protein
MCFAAMAAAAVVLSLVWIGGHRQDVQAQPVRASVGTEVVTAQGGWVLIGTFSATGAEPSDLAGGERTYDTAIAAIAAAGSGDDKIVHERIPYGCNGAQYYVTGTTDNQSVVLVAWSGARKSSDCILFPRGTLTWTVGTQAATTVSYEVADTLSVSGDTQSSSPWTPYSPADNTAASGECDWKGDTDAFWVPTTLGCDAQLWAKYF